MVDLMSTKLKMSPRISGGTFVIGPFPVRFAVGVDSHRSRLRSLMSFLCENGASDKSVSMLDRLLLVRVLRLADSAGGVHAILHFLSRLTLFAEDRSNILDTIDNFFLKILFALSIRFNETTNHD